MDVCIVPNVISCEASSRRGGSSRPRASRRGSTGGIGKRQIHSDSGKMIGLLVETRRRRSDGEVRVPKITERLAIGIAGGLENAGHHEHEADATELAALDVSPTVLQESLHLVKSSTEKLQRRYSSSAISADVWKPKLRSRDDSASGSSGSGRRRAEQSAASRSGRSTKSGKSTRQSLDQHKAFVSAHRASNNLLGGRPRGNSPTSSPTITNSGITSRRRNSAPCGSNITMRRQKPPPIDEIALTSQEKPLPAGDVEVTVPVDPRDEEIEALQQAAKSSQRSLEVLSNEIRMLKEANKRLAQEMQEQEEACQKEIGDLKNELKACYKKNISLSKSSKADAATIERLTLELDKRDITIATLQDALAVLE